MGACEWTTPTVTFAPPIRCGQDPMPFPPRPHLIVVVVGAPLSRRKLQCFLSTPIKNQSFYLIKLLSRRQSKYLTLLTRFVSASPKILKLIKISSISLFLFVVSTLNGSSHSMQMCAQIWQIPPHPILGACLIDGRIRDHHSHSRCLN